MKLCNLEPTPPSTLHPLKICVFFKSRFMLTCTFILTTTSHRYNHISIPPKKDFPSLVLRMRFFFLKLIDDGGATPLTHRWWCCSTAPWWETAQPASFTSRLHSATHFMLTCAISMTSLHIKGLHPCLGVRADRATGNEARVCIC